MTAQKKSLPAKIAINTLEYYQQNLSAGKIGPSCRFTPTCSEYGRLAIGEHGFFRGSFMLLIRFAKCGPWHPGGWDPVIHKQ